MSGSWEDEETWGEDRYRRALKPRTVRIAVRPAGVKAGPGPRESARHLLAELLEIPMEERRRWLREPRFQVPELLDLLLELGHAALPFDLERAVELTTLAAEVGLRLPRRGEPEESAGLCRALCLTGTARRLVGDVALADAAFQQASPLAATITERGLFCRALALLRWDQGRMEEALALLQQAEQRFAEAQDLPEIAVGRSLLGLLHLDEGRISRAASCLAQASQDLPESFRPWLAAMTWLGLALCWAAGGRLRKARSARQKAWSFYGAVRNERALCVLRWLEGKGAHLMGDHPEAEALLGEVRRKMIDWRFLPEAALTTLDLALVWLDLGRGDEVRFLVAEIAATFAGRPGLELALDGLAQPGEDAAAGRLSPAAWGGLAPVLRMAFRLQGVPLQPVPFA
jgi:tetratricopeptide (TPR) repeat protein